MAFFVCFLLLLLFLSFQQSAFGAPKVPCFFIFGDSLLDNGNNNELETLAKVDYSPYGIDFPQGPTGRFTNGRNPADILAERLGFDTYIPPFAMAQGQDQDIIKGMNYGSGGSGIRSETGGLVGDRMSLDRQLLNHGLIVSRITNLLENETSAKKHLRKCLYYFSIGSNDYLSNYFRPDFYPTSRQYTPEQYATVLVQQYSQQLQTLYNYGARKISVSGIGPIGCIPSVLGRRTLGSSCVDSMNDAVTFFNKKLKLVIKDLNHNLTDAEFIFANHITQAELFDLGIEFMSEPCCNVSTTTGVCIPGQTPCPNRAQYAFYDNFHTTEILNKVLANTAYLDIQKLICEKRIEL